MRNIYFFKFAGFCGFFPFYIVLKQIHSEQGDGPFVSVPSSHRKCGFAELFRFGGRTKVGKCLFEFSIPREDVLRRLPGGWRAASNSHPVLKTRDAQTGAG